ncbi:hypothetical protein [Actinoplanes derwentensis]|uniref:hypothetical protein n=1 Tax=Actinoplanes derwentensis TaxID=113562 RepID=UPI001E4C6D0E|nr:hypothetical protein [Actinoplanes derwentensis]
MRPVPAGSGANCAFWYGWAHSSGPWCTSIAAASTFPAAFGAVVSLFVSFKAAAFAGAAFSFGAAVFLGAVVFFGAVLSFGAVGAFAAVVSPAVVSATVLFTGRMVRVVRGRVLLRAGPGASTGATKTGWTSGSP